MEHLCRGLLFALCVVGTFRLVGQRKAEPSCRHRPFANSGGGGGLAWHSIAWALESIGCHRELNVLNVLCAQFRSTQSFVLLFQGAKVRLKTD